MDQFMDAIGPVFIGALFVLVAYLFYRLVLHTTVLTQNAVLDIERRQIENKTAEANGRLVTQNQQAMLMSRAHLEAGVLYGQQFQVLLADVNSRRLPQPALHTYAPHIRYDNDVQTQGLLPEQSTVHVDPLSAMECYQRGFFNDPQRLMWGFGESNEAAYSALERTYGVCVAGLPGMGKSNLMRFAGLQMALHGAQLAIVDPHAMSGSDEGLAAASTAFSSHLWEAPAVDTGDIVRLLQRIDTIGQARISGKDITLWPLLLLADEVTTLICDDEYGEQIKRLLLRINRNYRKARLYVLAAGHDWLAGAQRGDTTLRNSFVCKAVCRIDSMNAGKLLPSKKMVQLAPSLAEGQTIFVPHNATEQIVNVPYCPSWAVGQILGGSTSGLSLLGTPTDSGSTSHTGKRTDEPVGAGADREVDGSAEITIDTEHMKRIKELAGQGASTFKIVKTVFKVTGGRGLRNLLDQVNFILGRDA